MQHYQALVVDDDPENRYILDLSFRNINWIDPIKILDSTERLLNYLHALPDSCFYPSLIVLNYDMQKRNGAEVLTLLKQQESFKHIPVVIYAKSMSPLLREKLLTMGALSCYQESEPEQIATLVAHIRALAETLPELPKPY